MTLKNLLLNLFLLFIGSSLILGCKSKEQNNYSDELSAQQLEHIDKVNINGENYSITDII